jgi:hypothetical protein
MSAPVRDRVSAYIDRELPAPERAGIEAHLRECPECARALEEMRAVDALARGHEVEPPAGYFDALPGRVRARLSPPARARVPAWAIALAAGLVVAVIAPIALRTRPASVPETLDRVRPAAAPPAAAVPGAVSEPAEARSAPAAPAAQTGVAPTPRPADADAVARRGRTATEEKEASRAAAPDPRRVAGFAVPVVPAAPAPAGPAAAGARPEAARTLNQDVDAEEDAEELALVDDSGVEPDAAGRPPAAVAAAPAARARPGADERFRSLSTRAARSAAEARALRDAWRAFVQEDPDGAHADLARVRALEAGAAAWRLGGAREDRALVERDAREYLRRADVAHKERVRALLAGLEP